MRSIVLITSANINTSAGNVTLILRRAEAIYDVFKYKTRIIVYKGISQEKVAATEEFYSIDYTNDFQELLLYLKKYTPRLVILYGYSAGLLSRRIKKTLAKSSIVSEVVYDVQGAVEEKWEYASSIKARLKYIPQYFAFKKIANSVDSFFVVSDELKDNCIQKINQSEGKKFYKIRCGVNEVPNIELLNQNRVEIRNKYKIPMNSVVFAYSGYRSAWQKVDEIIDEFSMYDKAFANAFFCFFCNSDDEFVRKLETTFPNKNFLVTLLDSNEYQKTLNACDVGYILRDYKETNRVAFPNKFSDYLSSGMLIGLNHSLPEPLRILINNGLSYVDTDESLDKKIKTIKTFVEDRNSYLRRSREVCKKELLFSEQVKQELYAILHI